MTAPSYLPYHEPSLVELLISSTFLLALNSINSFLDRTLACGLIGQVLIGTAWGEAGARWLPIDFQRVVSNLGYLGLILVVYAGGVETNVVALRKNLILSIHRHSGATLLPAFAASAALCSTSLGTTFSVLQTSELSRTRLGAVLASAALLDDVVGLVMVRIITNLGQKGNSGIELATILRPVLVSVVFAVVVSLTCRYVLKPGKTVLDCFVQEGQGEREEGMEGNAGNKTRVTAWVYSQEAAFVAQTALLILLIVAANYTEASILLTAYLAGVVVSWWSGQPNGLKESSQSPSAETHSAETSTERQVQGPDRPEHEFTSNGPSSGVIDHDSPTLQHTASGVFDTYYAQAVNRVLKPFFFASIGFSVPISQLFVGEIVWRGIIYSILMIIGKLVCGLCLVRFPISISDTLRRVVSFIALKYDQVVSKIRSWGFRPTIKSRVTNERQSNEIPSAPTISIEPNIPPSPQRPRPISHASSSSPSPELAAPPKPLSLYPAGVISCAMVARGEIGFLISSTAESQGVFHRIDEDASKASQVFLIVTWAIFLCTILGPLCTGLLVRRIKKLEKARGASRGGGQSVLGVWGVG
ncbi:Sodium/hydrogen exchanger family-domain-containing protein [Xylaria digitata]|nr:Sodium/hydrogen exchanger family-domain-containing protein [Xylaria digitata]